MPNDYTLPPWRTAVLAQVLGGLMAIGLLALLKPALLQNPFLIALIQGGFAAFTSYKLEAPPWWHVIHAGFWPSIVLALALPISPFWYLLAFGSLLLIYWQVGHSRVPLYLSSREVATAISELIDNKPRKIIDIGCGTGSLIQRLAHGRPDCSFIGIEHAPLPWGLAHLTCRRQANCRIVRGDFMNESLGSYDIVYAFLSPVPMATLWIKACAEMRPGALLISNTFAVPDQEPAFVTEVPDRRHSRLLGYYPCGPEQSPGK